MLIAGGSRPRWPSAIVSSSPSCTCEAKRIMYVSGVELYPSLFSRAARACLTSTPPRRQVVFILNYASLVAVITMSAGRLALKPSPQVEDARQGIIRPLFMVALLCYYVFAIGWATEMMYCARATATWIVR